MLAQSPKEEINVLFCWSTVQEKKLQEGGGRQRGGRLCSCTCLTTSSGEVWEKSIKTDCNAQVSSNETPFHPQGSSHPSWSKFFDGICLQLSQSWPEASPALPSSSEGQWRESSAEQSAVNGKFIKKQHEFSETLMEKKQYNTNFIKHFKNTVGQSTIHY